MVTKVFPRSLLAIRNESSKESLSTSPSYSVVDPQGKSQPSTPKILSSKELTKLDPVELAKMLFDQSLEGFSRAMVCPIIGKGYL